MKKFTFLAFFYLFCHGPLSAQFLLGGQFNFSSVTEKQEGFQEDIKNTTTLVTLIPRLAYTSGNMWYGLDAGVSLVNEKRRFVGTTHTKTALATIAPFIRYTKRPVEHFGIWIEGQAGTSFGSTKNNDGEKTAKYVGLQVGLRPGVVFFIGNHLSFEASFGRLGYTTFTTSPPNNSRERETVSQAGFMLNSSTVLLDDTTLSVSNGFQFGANWLF